MEINMKRIMRDIEILNTFNATPEEGCTRFSYSKEDCKAREYLTNEMRKIGLEVMIDPIGNIRGRLASGDAQVPIVMSGSHIDTVYQGGKYDGILGVVCALEVARVLVENHVSLGAAYEVVVFAEEEGSNFGYNLVGSKAMVGSCTLEEIKQLKDNEGQSMYDKLKLMNLNPSNLSQCLLDPSKIRGMIELHIEQGNVLDVENKSVGIVGGIVGLQWHEIEIEGKANHAGATPMRFRKDPMVAAGSIIGQIPSVVKQVGDETTVATVGQISCYPNAVNVIPSKVKFTIDLRGMCPTALSSVVKKIREELNQIEKQGFVCHMRLLTCAKEVQLSDEILDIIENTAKQQNMSYKKMYSGANHDSSILAQIMNVAMIFVPSVDGRSHCKEEYTYERDIEIGAELLLGSIIRLSQNG